LSYNPSKKCVPLDTCLFITITSPSESEVLKAFKSEVSSNADVAACMSVTKIFLIPRLLGRVMSHSISNLHKYLHGSLHINSEQDEFFKEASAHLEVKVLEAGEPFDDPHNGIHVKYDDPKYGFSGIHQLAHEVAPFIDSSCSTSRIVPNLSIGWSTPANPHLYKNNRTNMVGSISPFLMKQSGIEGLPMKEKYKIVSIVCNLVRYFSHCGRTPTPYYHSADPPQYVSREVQVGKKGLFGIPGGRSC
jgi:hypothetical protein